MYVPGVLACSGHVEKGDLVAVSVAVEQPGADGGWGVKITRGTILQGSQAGKNFVFMTNFCLTIQVFFLNEKFIHCIILLQDFGSQKIVQNNPNDVEKSTCFLLVP